MVTTPPLSALAGKLARQVLEVTLGKSVVLPRFIYNMERCEENKFCLFALSLQGIISLRRFAAVSYYLTRLLFVAKFLQPCQVLPDTLIFC